MSDSPMFPLGMVVFPSTRFQLRIFEERYVKLVEDCTNTNRKFGVCLIAKGHEVGGGDERYQYGTISRIENVSDISSGQFLVQCVGEHRIEIAKWLSEDPYPTASIELSEVQDSDSISSHHLDQLRVIAERTSKNVEKLTGVTLPLLTKTSESSTDSIYELAESSFLGPYDRYQVLAANTLRHRFDTLKELLIGVDEIYANELKIRNQY
tara:strand:+ start:164 stop:790 length:627 start_codon:yes stop_codon:yes gene_type:complete